MIELLDEIMKLQRVSCYAVKAAAVVVCLGAQGYRGPEHCRVEESLGVHGPVKLETRNQSTISECKI